MTYHRIDFTKGFTKQFKKLPKRQQEKFYGRLKLFKDDPYASLLNNHGLKGKYLGYRSINIESDLRALYFIEKDVIVIFAFIGSHSQLYD